MLVNKNCKICGKTFYGFHTKKYCSDKCILEGHKISDLKWKKHQIIKKRYCIECNNILPKNANKFCTKECNIKFNKNIKKKKITNKRCKICGNFFMPKNIKNIYCKSEKCQEKIIYLMKKRENIRRLQKRNKLRKNIFIECKECGEKFNPKNLHYKYCSKECRKKREWIQQYKKNKIKYKSDSTYRLQVILRTRFKRALKNNSKKESVLKLIGCSIDELKMYLEKQFKTGMSWENYGIYTWHIDHIIPCFKFDLSKLKEREKCFHYTNLRPLWAKENLTRGDYDEIY